MSANRWMTWLRSRGRELFDGFVHLVGVVRSIRGWRAFLASVAFPEGCQLLIPLFNTANADELLGIADIPARLGGVVHLFHIFERDAFDGTSDGQISRVGGCQILAFATGRLNDNTVLAPESLSQPRAVSVQTARSTGVSSIRNEEGVLFPIVLCVFLHAEHGNLLRAFVQLAASITLLLLPRLGPFGGLMVLDEPVGLGAA